MGTYADERVGTEDSARDDERVVEEDGVEEAAEDRDAQHRDGLGTARVHACLHEGPVGEGADERAEGEAHDGDADAGPLRRAVAHADALAERNRARDKDRPRRAELRQHVHVEEEEEAEHDSERREQEQRRRGEAPAHEAEVSSDGHEGQAQPVGVGLNEDSEGACLGHGARVRAVHDHPRVARRGQRGLIQLVRGRVEVRVAVDLHDELEVRSFVAQVAALVGHDEAEVGVVLADEAQGAGPLGRVLVCARQVVARADSVHDVGGVGLLVGALAYGALANVELNGVGACFVLEGERVGLRVREVLPEARTRVSACQP